MQCSGGGPRTITPQEPATAEDLPEKIAKTKPTAWNVDTQAVHPGIKKMGGFDDGDC